MKKLSSSPSSSKQKPSISPTRKQAVSKSPTRKKIPAASTKAKPAPLSSKTSTTVNKKTYEKEAKELFQYLLTFDVCQSEETAKHPSQILDFLYLGNYRHSEDKPMLQEIGVSAVLNVALSDLDTNAAFYGTDFEFLGLDVKDEEEQDIMQYFERCLSFIESIRSKGKKILVHCAAGVSRSATIVSAYIMKTKKLKAKAALEFVKKQRPPVHPNEGFLKQLLIFEQQMGL